MSRVCDFLTPRNESRANPRNYQFLDFAFHFIELVHRNTCEHFTYGKSAGKVTC